MENFATFVTALYEGIFEDAAIRWPDLKEHFGKDLSYLQSAIKERGEAFITLTLPEYGKHFDLWLDVGHMMEGLPRGIPLHTTNPLTFRKPLLFSGLLGKIFDASGVLLADAEADAVLFFRTLTRICEKLEAPVSFVTLRKSVKEFLRCGQSSASKSPVDLG